MKNQKNLDNRVRYTRAALKGAMLSLMREKPCQKITVKELCQRAEINRGTFYLHYASPEALVKDIEAQYIRENMGMFSDYWQDADRQTVFARMLACIQRDRETFCLLTGPNGDPQFLPGFIELSRERTLEGWQREYPDYDRQKLDFLFDYVYTGTLVTMLKWIEEPGTVTAEELARRLEALGHHALMAVKTFR